MLLPQSEAELVDIVRSAAAAAEPLALSGHDSKAGWGRALIGRPLSLRKFAGITDYVPAELVMTAGAGTPLADIERALTEAKQYLAFEPVDLGPLYGGPRGAATIGGVMACNLSGPRRAFAGAARDFFLGFKGVNGSGELVKAGAKVVKNVTGYDLPKLMAGSFGTLVAMTEVTLKVVPAPEATTALILDRIAVTDARRLMTAALSSTAEPTGAVYQPSTGRLVFRLEGSGPSVAYRADVLAGLVGQGSLLDGTEAIGMWRDLRHLALFVERKLPVLWLLSVPPASFDRGLENLLDRLPGALAQVDWGGGRIWLAHQLTDAADAVQAVHGYLAGRGHATLLMAPSDWRARENVFMPEAPLPLLRKIRAAFDPGLIFNRGRLHPDL